MRSAPLRLAPLVWVGLVGCPLSAEHPEVGACVADVRRLIAHDDFASALARAEGCEQPSALLAIERARLLYRLGRPAMEAWASAYRRARAEDVDDNLVATAGWAYAQLALDHGDVGEAKEVLGELRERKGRFDPKRRVGLDYLQALVAKADGAIDEAHRRFSELAASPDRVVARSARVAQANLWGRTGRSAQALGALRELLEDTEAAEGLLQSELLHAAAWAGVLVVEASVGRDGVAGPRLVAEVRSLYDRLDAADRTLGRNERTNALRVERAWLDHAVSGSPPSEGHLPKTATFPRDRGYLALLRSAQLRQRDEHTKAAKVLQKWLQEEGDTDPEIALRMYLALAALNRTEFAETAWRLVGRQFLATHTLSGRSDTLARFRPAFAADIRRRLALGQMREAFGLAATYTGAPFRRLALQACLSDPNAGLGATVKKYWALRQRAAEAAEASHGRSIEGLRRYRANAEANARAQDQLLDTIDERCAVGLWDSWSAQVSTPAKTHDRIRAALARDETLILPFGGGAFVVTAERTEYVNSTEALPLDAAGRVFVVHEVDRRLTASLGGLDAKVWHLPDAGWLAARRENRCRGAGRPLIVSDPQSDLPFARRAGRWLSARHRTAVHLSAERASVSSVQNLWSDAEWFFFGGHAIFDADAGETTLVFADGRIDPAKILLRGDAPCVALLFGCETAVRSNGERPRIGLVDALLAAGATVVVATANRIEDATAYQLTRRLKLGTSSEIEATLRRALRDLSDPYPELPSQIQVWGTPPP